MWKIFCRKMETSFEEKFYAIFVPNSKWKFSWCLDPEGNFTGNYYDNEKGMALSVTWAQFDNGNDAAKYIADKILKQNSLISDVSRFYLDDIFYERLEKVEK